MVSTDVEDFDTAAYKQDDLQSYVDESIDDYNKKNDGSIKLKKLTVEKKKGVQRRTNRRKACLIHGAAILRRQFCVFAIAAEPCSGDISLSLIHI